ncbi:MAG: hypothetical protein FJ265_14820 [Planctomycetes bacterium]|nr:hypothetical protein [Planctomycetota bacterium]
MSQPIATVAVVATTAVQAKVFAALLQAEGIPAHIDGDGITDHCVVTDRDGKELQRLVRRPGAGYAIEPR